MEIGLSESEIEGIVLEELLTGGRYTLAEPGGKPILTSQQRSAIARALARLLAANNDAIRKQLEQAGVSVA